MHYQTYLLNTDCYYALISPSLSCPRILKYLSYQISFSSVAVRKHFPQTQAREDFSWILSMALTQLHLRPVPMGESIGPKGRAHLKPTPPLLYHTLSIQDPRVPRSNSLKPTSRICVTQPLRVPPPEAESQLESLPLGRDRVDGVHNREESSHKYMQDKARDGDKGEWPQAKDQGLLSLCHHFPTQTTKKDKNFKFKATFQNNWKNMHQDVG